MSENDLQVRAEKRIGTVLCGKYRIDRVLGVGGMAVVYAATHRNQKRVALKMLHPELAIHEEVRVRFLREGYAANTVDHPGAVAVLDDDTTEDGVAFLVMERLEGEEVDRLWEQRGQHLPVDAVLAIANQLLDVLAAGHAKSIIHRDIKPANLYITTDGTLKVLDFGIARVRDAAGAGHAATGTGMMLGTPAYMAPEQALGKSREIDGTTDNWSVGATMFTLLSGQFVHEGETSTELVVKSATQPARSLAVVAPDVDRRVVEIIDRALGFQKSARWPTAIAMRDAVRALYLELFGTKVGKEPLERLVAQMANWLGHTEAIEAIARPASVAPANPPAHLAVAPAAKTPAAPARARLQPTRDMTALPNVSARPPTPRGSLPPPAPTRDMSVAAAPGDRPSAWPAVSPQDRAYPPRPLDPPRSEVAGASTARPVQADASIAPQGLPRSPPLALIIGLVAVATLLAVVGIGWLTLSHGSSATASATATATPPASATAPPLVVLEAAAPPAVTTSTIVEPATPSSRLPSPPPPVVANPAPPRPTHFIPVAAEPPPASRPSTPSNCDPPFTINLSGHRVPKPECL